MEESRFLPLPDYRLIYHPSIVGHTVVWKNDTFAQIGRLLEDHQGGINGRVRLIEPNNEDRVMGEACISDLTPCIQHGSTLPKKLVHQFDDQALDMYDSPCGSDYSDSSPHETHDVDRMATRGDIRRLEGKIQAVRRLLRECADNINNLS